MREQIEVVYENGVLRPLAALPRQYREHQHLTIAIEDTDASEDWLADADPMVSLEAVRQALAKVSGALAQLIHAERDGR
jgi:predicted DNA-binding antitoxin AbrB/MazE fold protein